MRGWAANRAAVPVLVASLIAALLALPGSAVLVAFPNLTGGPGFAAPLSALLPLVPAIALAGGLARQDAVRESLSVRRVRLFDVALAVLIVAFGAVAAQMSGAPALWEAFRNALGYCGLTLIAAAAFSPRSAALPAIAWAIASAMGLLPLGDDLLAWPMAPGTALLSWAAPLVLTLVGPVVYLTRTPRL